MVHSYYDLLAQCSKLTQYVLELKGKVWNNVNRAAEDGFMGMGIGAAMTGLRPIVEGMNMGFLLLAFNQISNNCGMLHYTSGGQFKVFCLSFLAFLWLLVHFRFERALACCCCSCRCSGCLSRISFICSLVWSM
jgi:hypothetical protein